MTKDPKKKQSKLALEILKLIGFSAIGAFVLFFILTKTTAAIAENYVFQNNIVMDEFDWISVDRWIYMGGACLSGLAFSILFLGLLADRITYIRKITDGIDKLHDSDASPDIPLEGSNELTQLAASINDMAQVQKEIREKEQALAQEKDNLIRTLSHDIRTPLTSILAYSDYLSTAKEVSKENLQDQMEMIKKKALQIREMTDILLDGSKRQPQWFEDGKLLLEQIATETLEELEDDFQLQINFHDCPNFSGNFDVQELQRIFDNLSSNIRKYADPDQPVSLSATVTKGVLTLVQKNGKKVKEETAESFKIGILSIRRIAQLYGGTATIHEEDDQFIIEITLSEIL